MRLISILISSRADGNVNHNLVGLLDSLRKNTTYPDAVEVLVKYDADDWDFPDVRTKIISQHYPFRIKFAVGLRERGYIDIHKGYNQLLDFVDPSAEIITAMADDFTVLEGWDFQMRDVVKDAGDYFIIHQRKHPFLERHPDGFEVFRPNHEEVFFDMDFFDMFRSDNLFVIDEAPAWSKAVISAAGYFPISFTDAWTLTLEQILWRLHKENITYFMPTPFIQRTLCENDEQDNIRWNTDRKKNFEYIRSGDYYDMVESQAIDIMVSL